MTNFIVDYSFFIHMMDFICIEFLVNDKFLLAFQVYVNEIIMIAEFHELMRSVKLSLNKQIVPIHAICTF
jgi:hypothetical protein